MWNFRYKFISATNIQVKLNGKIIGNIKQKDHGFQYVVKGGKYVGEVFATIKQVKESIEAK